MERSGAPAWTRRRFVAVSGVAMATGGAWQRALAQDATPVADPVAGFDLPDEVFWAAYSALAYDQSVAIGDALQEAAGVKLNIHPTLGDEFTGELLRRDAVDFEATAVGGSIAAQEGVFEFASKDWGPQKVRLVLANTAEPIGYGIAVAGDLGVTTYADLQGKRVAWYLDFPVVNVNTEAYLAYAGLTWDDVERVEVEGFFDEALKALEDGSLDAAFAATTSKGVAEAAAGPRGLFWPSIDPEDDEGLARMAAVAPYFVLQDAPDGSAGDPALGQPGAHYAYPILIALERTRHDLVYNMTKAMDEVFPLYEGKVLGIDGWSIDDQYLFWFIPYHDGAVTYFKELGLWSDAAQAHNDQLHARQEALAAAWEALLAEKPEDLATDWAERRRQALEDGGFQVIF